jgi:hypothetical protein
MKDKLCNYRTSVLFWKMWNVLAACSPSEIFDDENSGSIATGPLLSSSVTHKMESEGFWQRCIKKSQWPESASELYWLSDRRLSAKLMSTYAYIGCYVVSVTDPYGRIYCFLDRSRYFFFQVAERTQLQSHYYSKNLVAPGIEPGPLDRSRTQATDSPPPPIHVLSFGFCLPFRATVHVLWAACVMWTGSKTGLVTVIMWESTFLYSSTHVARWFYTELCLEERLQRLDLVATMTLGRACTALPVFHIYIPLTLFLSSRACCRNPNLETSFMKGARVVRCTKENRNGNVGSIHPLALLFAYCCSKLVAK